MKERHVLLDGQHIGVLAEDDHGRHIFQYDADMGSGMALSLSMPVRGEAWSGRPVEAYIDGCCRIPWTCVLESETCME